MAVGKGSMARASKAAAAKSGDVKAAVVASVDEKVVETVAEVKEAPQPPANLQQVSTSRNLAIFAAVLLYAGYLTFLLKLSSNYFNVNSNNLNSFLHTHHLKLCFGSSLYCPSCWLLQFHSPQGSCLGILTVPSLWAC